MGEVKKPSDDKAGTHPARPDVAVQDAPDKVDGLDSVRQQTHGPQQKPGTGGDIKFNNTEGGTVGPDGFAIVGAPEKGPNPAGTPEKADIKVLPSLKPPFDAQDVANKIEQACNGGWTGIGTDVPAIDNALKYLSPEQIAQVDQKFAETHGLKYAAKGQRWGLEQEFRDEMSGATLDRHLAILHAKNEIPADKRVTGADVLRDDSGLKVGETNRVTLADGRMYDVYIPQNAQKPLPVVLMMHGASNATDMSDQRIMEKETGMNSVAEQYGFAVVYAYNESHHASGVFGIEQQPATWNLKGNKNFLATDPNYDDGKYLDRVIADVGQRAVTDEKRIGVSGMSDGARAAEQYALERPGKVSALVAMHGTWMDGNARPAAGNGLPTMMVNSTRDYMLPIDQGKDGWFGQKGRGMMSWLASSWIPGTADSRPSQQIGVFKDANQCEGEPKKSTVHDLELTEYGEGQCKAGPIKEYVVHGANHAWQDWRNDGGWYVVGMPDRNQNMSEETAKFILSHPLKRSL